MVQTQFDSPPPFSLDLEKKYQARITTDLGEMLLDLYAQEAPNTVNNFVFLAGEGYYDGVIFHRVIMDFMVQGGDPTGTGRGGPGYTFQDEFHPQLRHDGPGILSMANAGPNTNGSQFFLTHVATPWLDDKHSVFGKIVEGMDVLNAIPPRDPNDRSAPAVTMRSVEILVT
jgi:cyclophilin family peptidyl-prolyl cis-trans isomerase